MEEFKVDDLVTVKPTSPKFKYYLSRIGRVVAIPTLFINGSIDNIVVDFNGLECAFNKGELQKV